MPIIGDEERVDELVNEELLNNSSARDEEDVLQLQNDELLINTAGEKVAAAKDHGVDEIEKSFTLLYKHFLAEKYPIDIWIKDILVLILSRDL